MALENPLQQSLAWLASSYQGLVTLVYYHHIKIISGSNCTGVLESDCYGLCQPIKLDIWVLAKNHRHVQHILLGYAKEEHVRGGKVLRHRKQGSLSCCSCTFQCPASPAKTWTKTRSSTFGQAIQLEKEEEAAGDVGERSCVRFMSLPQFECILNRYKRCDRNQNYQDNYCNHFK